MEIEEISSDFEITIDFKPGEGDPARVFKTMSGLIDAFQSIDSHLLSSFDVSLEASLVLTDVEAGSLKAKFKDFVKGLPDEALKDANWKKIIGHFLVRSKYVLLEWLEDRTEIVHREDVRVLESDLKQLAQDTDLKLLPAYTAPRAEELLSDIHSIQESLANLENNDSASYRYNNREVKLNRDLQISNEIVREVLTKEIVKSSSRRVVKVKKPDYLGQSMWALQYDGRAIEAKITDNEWLAKFQSRIEEVKPGDSLDVLLYEEISYGYEGEIVHRHYEMEKVHKIIKPPTQRNIGF